MPKTPVPKSTIDTDIIEWADEQHLAPGSYLLALGPRDNYLGWELITSTKPPEFEWMDDIETKAIAGVLFFQVVSTKQDRIHPIVTHVAEQLHDDGIAAAVIQYYPPDKTYRTATFYPKRSPKDPFEGLEMN